MGRRRMASLLAFVLLVGGAGIAGATEQGTGSSAVGGASIGKGNVHAFAADFGRTFGAALAPLARKLDGLHRLGGAEERKVSLTIPGPKGTMKVAGFGLPLPLPARWEL